MNIKQLESKKAEMVKANGALIAKPEMSDEDRATFDANAAELLKVNGDIDRVHSQWESDRNALKVEVGEDFTAKKPFKSFGEQLLAIAKASDPTRPVTDPRLLAAVSGAAEAVPSDGGFLVQQDFSAEIFKRMNELGAILSRVRNVPISANANGLKYLRIDETSRATGSRWGGVQVYRTSEAGTVDAKKPKFAKSELTLKKLMGLFYATDELLADASALSAIAGEAFSEEFTFKIEDEIIRGSGADEMLGILNSPALVTVSKETGQLAASVQYENISKMWSRLYAKSRGNAAWFINQDVEPALASLSLVIGTGGVPVFLPPGGLSQSPYATLYGRPVIPVEYAATLGTVADIILADFSQYLTIDKGGLESASSIHVRFIYGENTFRWTLRNDGHPLWSAPLTPFKGTNTQSPFVVLATRA